MSSPRNVAAKALAKCAAYDPWFPKPDPMAVDAWAEQMDRYDVTMEEALAGVTRMYDENGSGFKPLPRDLIRAIRAERNSRPETQVEIDARNLANDQRLGLETDWARDLSDAEIATAHERRSAIEQFVGGFGMLPIAPPEAPQFPRDPQPTPAIRAVAESVAEQVARVRASAPPVWHSDLTDPTKVSEDGAQPQEGASQ